MSSSKPKAKSSVNEQVKAGLAAPKDFLGGHPEPEAEQQAVTSEGRAATPVDKAAAAEPKTNEPGAESGAQMNAGQGAGGESVNNEANPDDAHADSGEDQAAPNQAPEITAQIMLN